MRPQLSVVIATYNRGALLERLLEQLCLQTAPSSAFEVVVVDDGSHVPVAPRLASRRWPFRLRVERQANAGAAAARNRGAALAEGELLLLLDDDMQVDGGFVAAHLAAHEGFTGPFGKVVLGRICGDGSAARVPLFERWHSRLLERLAKDAAAGMPLRGTHLFSGNVSLRRDDFFAVGGFDAQLGHSEDIELGLRLEQRGCPFEVAQAAVSRHGSDHQDVAFWFNRAFLYGRYDCRIGQKHPALAHASPWRMLAAMSALVRPLLWAAVLAPALMEHVARTVMRMAHALAWAKAERLAHAGMSATHGIQYFRGLRMELGSWEAALASYRRFRALQARRREPLPAPAAPVATPPGLEL